MTLSCKDDPTCEVTCRAKCLDAVQKAIIRNIPYESALELIIKSQRPT